MSTTETTRTTSPTSVGANRVLTLSTIAFTLMFAVWLMFGILGKPIQAEFGLSNLQLSWISAVAVLNGSLWRLPAGILADRFGGKKIMVILLLAGAVFSYLVSLAASYEMLLVLAFLVGFVGNSFSSGIAWNSAWFPAERKGFALGVFGAGNVGASVTKFIGPPVIAATAGTTVFFGLQGGWRLIPTFYAVLLLVCAALVWWLAPAQDRMPGRSQPLGAMLRPLSDIRVWRFSLYYVIAFGAYVAYAAILPGHYMDSFGLDLTTAGLLTATFIFPASLLRPLGGWLSDVWGARVAMYATFFTMIVALAVLSTPSGRGKSGPYGLPLWLVVALIFVVGCAMGVAKAAVFKHIPTYFPDNVGSVGGLVGMLGGLGGFFLPPLFAYLTVITGVASTPFFVLLALTIVALIWMHMVITHMDEKLPGRPDLVEVPPEVRGSRSGS
ncbi:MFS transporter [Tessaracoccus antarcticus]|uniref:NarK/NasA family nitrate transporter n=1 Tax=Tessaracoccus antarcticus TaxID=2479848 RepID=A0A3M0GCS7_9ACTN|nr:MFS transporter [Tessaracoccus antarcticus]RMB62108.1 NarK/NasA family nitrate transporter [Tessaracoccus antarcticus]